MLLRRIERYLRISGMTAARFGRESVRDPRLVFDLRRGREPRARLNAALHAYLDRREVMLDDRPWAR